MSKLQAIRIGRDYQQQEVVNMLQAAGCRVDSSLLSKMENDLCLPTPPTADKLCNLLGCDIGDIYQPHELDFSQCSENAKNSPSNGLKKRETRTNRKMQFRLTQYALQVFASGALGLCGYRTQTEWFYECVRQLEEKSLRIKEKAARSVGAETDGKQVNECGQTLFTSNITQAKEVCQDA